MHHDTEPIAGTVFRHPALQSVPFWQFNLFRVWNRTLKTINFKTSARTYFGSVLRCEATDLIQGCIIHFGVWEPDISAAIEDVVKPGETVVDVGANIGYVSLLASHLVGRSGEVIAIEASPSIFRQLTKNIEANGASNIKLLNVAVSDKRGLLRLYHGKDGNCGMASTTWEEGLKLEAEVQAFPLDEILTPAQCKAASLIKIDIEGGELPVLSRLMDTLDLYSPTLKILVELNSIHDPAGAKQIFDRMLSNGFKAFAVVNSYSHKWYLSWKERSATVSLAEVPHNRQTDILFMR